MNDQQLTLGIKRSAVSLEKDRDHLLWLLKGRGWLNAAQIASLHGGWDDRHIRKLAELSEGQILSGQQGYKLTTDCTPEEVRHACNWLRAQAEKMTQRSLNIANVFHRAATNRGAESIERGAGSVQQAS